MENLKSSSDFLPALVEQRQLWFDSFAVATAVGNDLNGCVTDSVNLTHELIVFSLQFLQYAYTITPLFS